MKKQTIITFAALSLAFAACKTNQPQEQNGQRNGQRSGQQRGERPNMAELFTKMDSNQDGLLSSEEVDGPLKNHFSEIDANSDGFLTKEELENAPRPERGNQPGRRQ